MNASKISTVGLLTLTAALAYSTPALGARDDGTSNRNDAYRIGVQRDTNTDLFDNSRRIGFAAAKNTDVGGPAEDLARPYIRSDDLSAGDSRTNVLGMILNAYVWQLGF